MSDDKPPRSIPAVMRGGVLREAPFVYTFSGRTRSTKPDEASPKVWLFGGTRNEIPRDELTLWERVRFIWALVKRAARRAWTRGPG